MNSDKSEILVVNRILGVFQLIFYFLGIYLISRYLIGCSGSRDNPVTGWFILFGGAFLIICLGVMFILMLPICIANLILSIKILQHYGKNIFTIIFLVLSAIFIGSIILIIIACAVSKLLYLIGILHLN